MEKRKEWLEMRSKVADLHPAMHACHASGIGFALEAAKGSVTLRKDTEHLRAIGILNEDDYSKFTDELIRYCNSHFEELINKFSTCISRK
ncbi:MAG: hypothetical protein JRC90_12200 [Deltaproteobacteria bacterium]|nr:hypothetical protein [Deltaproteobacteria bacterium]